MCTASVQGCYSSCCTPVTLRVHPWAAVCLFTPITMAVRWTLALQPRCQGFSVSYKILRIHAGTGTCSSRTIQKEWGLVEDVVVMSCVGDLLKMLLWCHVWVPFFGDKFWWLIITALTNKHSPHLYNTHSLHVATRDQWFVSMKQPVRLAYKL